MVSLSSHERLVAYALPMRCDGSVWHCPGTWKGAAWTELRSRFQSLNVIRPAANLRRTGWGYPGP